MNTYARRATNLEVLNVLAEALNRQDVDAAMTVIADNCVYFASFGPELDWHDLSRPGAGSPGLPGADRRLP